MELLYLISNNFKAGSKVPPHTHNCYEFVFYETCESLVSYVDTTDDNSANQFNFGKIMPSSTVELQMRNNSFFIVPPRIIHNESHLSDGRVYAIGFAPSAIELELINNLSMLESINASLDIVSKIHEMAEEFTTHHTFSKEMLDSLLTQLLVTLVRKNAISYNQERNIDYVNYYINQYFYTKVDVAELAKQLNYSESHFRLLFKKMNGISIGQYIINKKIEYIKHCLLDTNLTIKQIADQLSFTDYYSFSSFFKKHTGFSPREFKYKNSEIKN